MNILIQGHREQKLFSGKCYKCGTVIGVSEFEVNERFIELGKDERYPTNAVFQCPVCTKICPNGDFEITVFETTKKILLKKLPILKNTETNCSYCGCHFNKLTQRNCLSCGAPNKNL